MTKIHYGKFIQIGFTFAKISVSFSEAISADLFFIA